MTWRGEAEAALLDVVDALDHLLTTRRLGADAADLVFLYDLPDSGDLLLEHVGRMRRTGPRRRDAADAARPGSLMLLEAMPGAGRRRPVRPAAVGLAPRRPTRSLAWEERTLSLAELAAELLPGYDLAADPWLFRRLTRTLDRRMLALLASPGELAAARPFALDLNVASLLGPEFLRFDAALPPALRGRVVLALSPADVVADARPSRSRAASPGPAATGSCCGTSRRTCSACCRAGARSSTTCTALVAVLPRRPERCSRPAAGAACWTAARPGGRRLGPAPGIRLFTGRGRARQPLANGRTRPNACRMDAIRVEG